MVFIVKMGPGAHLKIHHVYMCMWQQLSVGRDLYVARILVHEKKEKTLFSKQLNASDLGSRSTKIHLP
jgi:hypothetical protein